MTADEFIIDLLTNGQRLVPGAAVRLLEEVKDVHAHELAERIRRTALERLEVYDMNAREAADLIDPEAQS